MSTAASARRPFGGLPANYWKLWVSSAASNLADGAFWIAFPLLAVQLTDSPVLVAGVSVVARLPWLVFALVAGALADRHDRRRTMAGVAVLRTLVTVALAVGILAGVVSLPVLYVTAFVLGIGETLFDTAAQSIMPTIVDRDQLSRANGRLYAAELTANQFVGPPLGGILAGIGIALAFAGSAVAFAIAAVGLALLSGSFRPPATERRTSIATDIREGLGYLWHHRLLRTLAIMVGVTNLASSAVFAIFVLYAVAPGPMGLSEAGFGALMTTMAIGSLVGSLVVERFERWLGRANLLLFAVVVVAVMTLVPAITTNVVAVGASFAASGVVIVMWNVVTVSLRQRIVPNGLLGRLNASYRLLAWGSQPLGALLGGLVAEAFGLQAVFVLGAIVSATLVVGRLIVTDEAIDAAERTGDDEAARDAAVGSPRGSESG